MSNDAALENGVYCVKLTHPPLSSIPDSITSSGVLLVENQLFDYVKETSKSTKSLSINVPNATALDDDKDHTDFNDNCHRKISSTERLSPPRRSDYDIDAASSTCCSKKIKKYFCNTLVVVSLVTVIGLYSLGIVFFYTNVPENESIYDDALRNRLIDELELCLRLENIGSATQTPDGTCVSYTDDTCLLTLQSVATTYGINATGNSIMVQPNTQAGGVDPSTIFGVFDTYRSLISEECQNDGVPLFCQYFYPICDPTDGKAIMTITEQQCTMVIEGVCRDALQLASNIPSFIIPDCSEFDSNSSTVNATWNAMENVSKVATNSIEMNNTGEINNITCHDQFDMRCGMCVPSCKRFSETSEDRQRTIDIFFIIAALTCVIGGTFVIIVSILRRDIMFDFPSVLIIYMTIVMMVISILVLISYGGRDSLYCTHPELPLAYEEPTIFCQLSGFILHAGVLQIVLYWLLHLIHLFLKFIFPFAIRRFDTRKWKRIFHITEVILIILLTSIAPVCVILASKYYPYGYPPVLCIPNADLTFYTLVLPIIVMLCLGTCIILLMLWRLQMRTGVVQTEMSKISRLLRLTTAEFKVMILLCFFLTFGVVNAIYFSLYSRNYDFVLSLALEYFVCQRNGNDESCEDHKREIETNRYHGLANASYFLMGLLTISNFLFAIHVKQLKGQVRRLSVKAVSRIRSTMSLSRVGATVQSNKQSRDS